MTDTGKYGKVRVAVDAMGGDYAPGSPVQGAIDAAKERGENLEVILVGNEKVINDLLVSKKINLPNLKVVNADEVISMNDTPAEVYKSKPHSSLNVALDLQKNGDADALISAGNTGAVLLHSTLKLGKLKGVGRPTIGAFMPSKQGFALIFDVGATVDSRANHLREYGVMGSIYMRNVFDIKNPRVGLLSVGEEKSKGNEVTLEAFKLLETANLNFIGNVEGNDILNANVDVAVCDGFTGNIIIKFAESVLDLLKAKMKKFADKGFFQKIWIGMYAGTMKSMLNDFDYQWHGGVPLLGINGVSIIGHGKSTPLAVKNMIKLAEEIVRKEVNKKIETELAG
jgi:glycerol-3-phosphate acyltransferase PlsX